MSPLLQTSRAPSLCSVSAQPLRPVIAPLLRLPAVGSPRGGCVKLAGAGGKVTPPAKCSRITMPMCTC